MLLRGNKWPLRSCEGRGEIEEEEEGERGDRRGRRDGSGPESFENFAGVICVCSEVPHSQLMVSSVASVCQGLDLIGKLRISVCLCGESWLPLRLKSSWLHPTFTTTTPHSAGNVRTWRVDGSVHTFPLRCHGRPSRKP